MRGLCQIFIEGYLKQRQAIDMMISLRTRYRVLLVCVIALMSQLSLLTQSTTGEFCVEAFEDRDGNGVHDAGEPFLTRGLSAQLLDANNIVIQTALIDNSPTAGRGLICFQAPPAQYTLSITSAEFLATTASNLTVNLASNDRLLLEYGGQRVQVAPVDDATSADSSTTDTDELTERAIIAGTGAVIAMFITMVLGFLLYVIFLRGRGRNRPLPPYQYAQPDDYRYRPPTPTGTSTGTTPIMRPPTAPTHVDTGQYHVPQPTDTGHYQAPTPPPTQYTAPDIGVDDDDDSGFDFDTGELPKI